MLIYVCVYVCVYLCEMRFNSTHCIWTSRKETNKLDRLNKEINPSDLSISIWPNTSTYIKIEISNRYNGMKLRFLTDTKTLYIDVK